MTSPASWHLAEGDSITAELSAVKLLGGGSAYEAYLAFDEITYAPVVVKVLRPDQVDDESSLRGLRREVDTLAKVNHPVVVRGLRHELEGRRPHVVLEHIEGPRLSTLVRRYGPLQPQQYLPLGLDLASALHYLGGLEVAHLDVKPSNIIMGSPARLIDLSVARSFDLAAALTARIGTDAYMAPEQADPRGRFRVPGGASDVWGLGGSLFEAVTGHRPFRSGDLESDRPEEQYPQLVDDPAELPNGVPDEVAKVLYAALERDPANRPRPHEVSDMLAPVLDRLPRARLSSKLMG
jgi:eukaryotic-like serine/threonine-protein kinase